MPHRELGHQRVGVHTAPALLAALVSGDTSLKRDRCHVSLMAGARVDIFLRGSMHLDRHGVASGFTGLETAPMLY
jgi:hypothetical protein